MKFQNWKYVTFENPYNRWEKFSDIPRNLWCKALVKHRLEPDYFAREMVPKNVVDDKGYVLPDLVWCNLDDNSSTTYWREMES